jgi:hypothetical protein
MLHRFNDSSTLRVISAKDLIRIPIWHGNRILDSEHKAALQTQIANDISSLDRQLYHCVTYKTMDEDTKSSILKTVLVDGQHRSIILNEYFQNTPGAENFNVLLCDYECSSETDVIERFKILNTIKPIHWTDDPKLSAAPYIIAIERELNRNPKQKFVRQGFTYRPYMSVDSLRDALIKYRVGIRIKMPPDEFAKQVAHYNKYLLKGPRTNDKQYDRALKIGFMLGLDKSFSWIDKVASMPSEFDWDSI